MVINRAPVRALLLLSLPLTLALSSHAFAAQTRTHPGASSLASLTINANDVSSVFGKGYRKVIGSVVSNKQVGASSTVVGLKPAAYVAHGRLTGYVIAFERTSGKSLGSIVSGIIDQFKDSSGSHWEFGVVLHYHQPKQKGVKTTLHITPLSGLGDEALVGTGVTKTQGTAAAYSVEVEFVRGRYVLAVGSTGSRAASTSSVISLAHILDNRIQQHG
jgi:hypothetical protein